MRRLSHCFACLVLLFASACAASGRGGDGGPGDAATDTGIPPTDAMSDSIVPPVDGGGDANTDTGPSDGGPIDGGPIDGGPIDSGPGDAGTDGGPVDSGPGDAGGGATLLITDVGENAVYHLRLDGSTITRYAPMVAQIRGVSFDRTATGGFWLSSNTSTLRGYRCDWSGAVVDMVDTGRSTREVYGMDAWINGSGDQELAIINLNSASVDVISSFTTDGTFRSAAGHVVGGLTTGFWGTSVTGFMGGTERWVTRRSTTTLEYFEVATQISSTSLPVGDLVGVARTSAGTFYVVDQMNARVVHYDDTFMEIDRFDTPGSQPAGISYSE